MKVGIGLPSTIPGVDGRRIVDWARHAEEAGFSSLGSLDRAVYASYESMTTLAAAAAVTERVHLVTTVLVASIRGNGVPLAKQAATVDSLSGGRLMLGMGVGNRQDDHDVCGVDYSRRGRLFDRALATMSDVWAGRSEPGPIGPAPPNGRPTVLIGGYTDAAVRRTLQWGDGWIAGGGGPPVFAPTAEKVRRAWAEAGRPQPPRLMAIAYFSLGPDADADAGRYLRPYYSQVPERIDAIVAGTARSPELVHSTMKAYEDLGCDELILYPCSDGLEQVDLLAAVALG